VLSVQPSISAANAKVPFTITHRPSIVPPAAPNTPIVRPVTPQSAATVHHPTILKLMEAASYVIQVTLVACYVVAKTTALDVSLQSIPAKANALGVSFSTLIVMNVLLLKSALVAILMLTSSSLGCANSALPSMMGALAATKAHRRSDAQNANQSHISWM